MSSSEKKADIEANMSVGSDHKASSSAGYSTDFGDSSSSTDYFDAYSNGNKYDHSVYPLIGRSMYDQPVRVEELQQNVAEHHSIEYDPVATEELRLKTNPNFERELANGQAPLLGSPWKCTLPSESQVSFLVEFMLPSNVNTLSKLLNELSGSNNCVTLSVDSNHLKKHFQSVFVFSPDAAHFTPHRVDMVNCNTKGVPLGLYGQLWNRDTRDNPRLFSKTETINTRNAVLGFKIPGDREEELQEVKKMIWDINPDVMLNPVVEQWKHIDLEKLQESMESCAQTGQDALYYHINAPDPSSGLSLDDSMHYYVLGNMHGWLEQAKTDEQYGDWSMQNLYTDPKMGKKMRIPRKFALDSMDQLKKLVGKSNTLTFDKPLELKLSATNITDVTNLQNSQRTDKSQGMANFFVDKDISMFSITLRIYGTFHTATPQGKPYNSRKLMVGNYPHTHSLHSQRMKEWEDASKTVPVQSSTGSRRFKHMNP